ncbi:MAG TPA: LptE family protein [Chitinophagaceae bacterium]|nr:LptE family protein [Chitinophagaceae bacterium]
MQWSNKFRWINALALCVLVLLSGCWLYKFNASSIDANAHTVNVNLFASKAPLAPPTLAQKLTEVLRNQITSQTRLTQENSDSADYVFTGDISGYDISNAAVTNVEQASSLRLTITVSVEFRSRTNPKNNFSTSFSRSEDFAANISITTIQDQLITKINSDLSDDIFNRAFANW